MQISTGNSDRLPPTGTLTLLGTPDEHPFLGPLLPYEPVRFEHALSVSKDAGEFITRTNSLTGLGALCLDGMNNGQTKFSSN